MHWRVRTRVIDLADRNIQHNTDYGQGKDEEDKECDNCVHVDAEFVPTTVSIRSVEREVE